MKKIKTVLAFALAFAMVASLTGCGNGSGNGGSADATTGARSEANATEGNGTEGGGAAASASDLNIMLETPVQSLDPQEATDGTSFEVIADFTDGLTYTFHIREDANWSNGTPVTAADFIFAWQRAVDPEMASEYSYMLSDIGQVKNAAEIIAGEMDKSELGVTAVDDKTLQVELNQDSQQALMSYQAGNLDMTLVNGEQVDQVKDDPEFLAVGAGYLWYVSPNIAEVPELANQNIRMALTMAIDREAITTDVLKDGSTPTYTAVPIEFATGPDGSDFAGDQTMFSDVCAYDAEKAAEYWAKGLEELSITELTLDMVVDADDAPQKVAQVLQEQWQSTLPGFTVNITVEPKKQRVQDLQDGNFQLGLTRWGPDYADPMTYLNMWITDNNNNYGLWSNAEYNAIIAECTTGDLCTDLEGRWARMFDAEKIVMDEAVIFPLYTQCNAEMISSKVTGVEFHPVALNRVYKNAAKAE